MSSQIDEHARKTHQAPLTWQHSRLQASILIKLPLIILLFLMDKSKERLHNHKRGSTMK
jgi:hypothetical protein